MWSLATKQDVVDLVPGCETELKDSWSEMVEALIRQYMGEDILGDVETITDEEHSGDGTSILVPRKQPIVSVTSLSVAGAALTAADYAVFGNYIQLRNGMVFTRGVLNVKLTYVAGDMDVDPTVRLCATAMLVAMLNYKRRGGADGSVKWGATETRAGEETPNQNIGLTSHLDRIMKRTLRRRRARIR